jgi:hypothetical protein
MAFRAIPEIVLFGSLAIMVTKNDSDGRPMALRHQVSLILRFGRLVNPDPALAGF